MKETTKAAIKAHQDKTAALRQREDLRLPISNGAIEQLFIEEAERYRSYSEDLPEIEKKLTEALNNVCTGHPEQLPAIDNLKEDLVYQERTEGFINGFRLALQIVTASGRSEFKSDEDLKKAHIALTVADMDPEELERLGGYLFPEAH